MTTLLKLAANTQDVPPHSLEAERQVLGSIFIKPELLPEVELSTADFYGEGNARIWAAIQYCAAEGIELDQLHVRERLVDLKQLASVGGDDYLLSLTDTIADVVPADIVRKLARQRAVQALGRGLARAGAEGDMLGAQTAVHEIQRTLDDAQKAPLVTWRSAFEVFAPLPPVPWRVRGLQICPGRPSMFVGYGASAKTLAAQSLALACASGRPVWGFFDAPPMRVRHLDYEQGWRATARRYQRLAYGMDLDARDIADRLNVAVFPGLYLDQQGAVDAYAKVCDGADLVIIDSFKAATPTFEENDNAIRQCLDALTRVSEKAGCTFLVLHHAGKGEPGARDQRALGRGASSIFDASGSWFNFFSGSDKTDPRTVKQAKQPAESEGTGVADFMLDVLDVHAPERLNAGLRVSYKPITEPDHVAASSARYDALVHTVLDLVRRTPGKPREELAARAGVAKSACITALDQLERDGAIYTVKGEHGAKLTYPKDSHHESRRAPA